MAQSKFTLAQLRSMALPEVAIATYGDNEPRGKYIPTSRPVPNTVLTVVGQSHGMAVVERKPIGRLGGEQTFKAIPKKTERLSIANAYLTVGVVSHVCPKCGYDAHCKCNGNGALPESVKAKLIESARPQRVESSVCQVVPRLAKGVA